MHPAPRKQTEMLASALVGGGLARRGAGVWGLKFGVLGLGFGVRLCEHLRGSAAGLVLRLSGIGAAPIAKENRRSRVSKHIREREGEGECRIRSLCL